jgi:hypothetical protein
MTADPPASIGVSEFLDWIAAIAEGRAADVETAAIQLIFKAESVLGLSQPDHLPVSKTVNKAGMTTVDRHCS